jgi:hypothetical protein
MSVVGYNPSWVLLAIVVPPGTPMAYVMHSDHDIKAGRVDVEYLLYPGKLKRVAVPPLTIIHDVMMFLWIPVKLPMTSLVHLYEMDDVDVTDYGWDEVQQTKKMRVA